MRGKGPSKPLNPAWDRRFLDTLAKAELDVTDGFTAASVVDVAGSAANEVLIWVAATAALAVAGKFSVVQQDYIAVPGWIAGMGHFCAMSTAA